MNINELKETWENLHQEGLETHTKNDIQKIISYRTTEVVSEINRKLFIDITITAIASIVSAFGIIFFYYKYDPIEHPWIDVSKIVPIQTLAFILFFVLFVFGWLEYKVVNRRFTSESVKSYISSLLISFQKYYRLFTVIVLLLLLSVFFVELDYFIVQEGKTWLFFKMGGSILLTAISYLGIRQYYNKSFDPYLTDQSRHHKELEE
jgi:hypothetical protein